MPVDYIWILEERPDAVWKVICGYNIADFEQQTSRNDHVKYMHTSAPRQQAWF